MLDYDSWPGVAHGSRNPPLPPLGEALKAAYQVVSFQAGHPKMRTTFFELKIPCMPALAVQIILALFLQLWSPSICKAPQ